MATHDVDQRIIGLLAKHVEQVNPVLASCLYRILGISIRLARLLVRARKLRKLDPSRDTKSLDLYHRIIFLSREGLYITEEYVLLFADNPQTVGDLVVEMRVFSAKLRASFYHILSLFHNNPPISSLSPLSYRNSGFGNSPLSPRQDNEQDSKRKSMSPRHGTGKENILSSRERQAALRDTIPSMVSEASYITNPYSTHAAISPPPGLGPIQIPQASNFLLPAINYLPIAAAAFNHANQLATELLPGSSPMRLSVKLEHCAFLWDCVHDYEGCRRMATRTIREVYKEERGMGDQEFEDAAILVGTLGKFMRRGSQESTPRVGPRSPPAEVVSPLEPVPPLPKQYSSSSGASRSQQTRNPGNPPSSAHRNTPPGSPTRPKTRRGEGGDASAFKATSTTPPGSPARPRSRETTTPPDSPSRTRSRRAGSGSTRGGNGSTVGERVRERAGSTSGSQKSPREGNGNGNGSRHKRSSPPRETGGNGSSGRKSPPRDSGSTGNSSRRSPPRESSGNGNGQSSSRRSPPRDTGSGSSSSRKSSPRESGSSRRRRSRSR